MKTPRQALGLAYAAKREQTFSNRRLESQAALYRPDAAYDAALELRRTNPARYYAATSAAARMSHTYYETAKAAAEQLNKKVTP
jgi:hypothetical protein